MIKKIRVLVVGCGHMGASHARAYHECTEDFEIVGLVARGAGSRGRLNASLGGRYTEFSDYLTALSATKPEAVCISTYTETHAPYALAAFEAGAHVFLEKPIANNIVDGERVIATARRLNRKLLIGYILQVHPAWTKFTELAQTLGKPLVMRMNLNQQSSGTHWETHKELLHSTSPLVDCGVHYVDVMCRMTESRPVSVNGIGARLSDEIAPDQINYGHLQVTFANGSVGWYEAGWGPMMSETAFFVKDGSARKVVSVSSRTKPRAPATPPRLNRIPKRRRCACIIPPEVPMADFHGRTKSSRSQTNPITMNSADVNRKSSSARFATTSISPITGRAPSTAFGSCWPQTNLIVKDAR